MSQSGCPVQRYQMLVCAKNTPSPCSLKMTDIDRLQFQAKSWCPRQIFQERDNEVHTLFVRLINFQFFCHNSTSQENIMGKQDIFSIDVFCRGHRDIQAC